MAATTNPDSPIAAAATTILHVPAATNYRRENETIHNLSPSTIFKAKHGS
ncbi:hypothetical protein V7087_12220 [Neobacillus niacini]